ncbi:hypothetical protein HDU78_010283 [Chytriomyces hyalinus]|nr:hypothetical protein HDU78_010283 [Chytriomyces hyalinus]
MSHVDQRQERPKRIKVIFAEKPAEEEVGTSSQDNTKDSAVGVGCPSKISRDEISLEGEQESEAEDVQSLLLFPRRVYRPSPLAIGVVAIDEVLVPSFAARPASIRVNASRIESIRTTRQAAAVLQQKLICAEMAEIQRQWELEQAAALGKLAAEIEADLFGLMDLD